MTELKKLLSIYLDLYLHQIIISGARTKEGASKIRIRPVIMKDKLYFQCTSTVGTKEIHENYEKEPLLEHIEGWITEDFRQLQLESELGSVNVLSSKKGKLTICLLYTSYNKNEYIDSINRNIKNIIKKYKKNL